MTDTSTRVDAPPKVDFSLVAIRAITAVSLFAVLGKANVWMDTTTNSILALGYRFMLVLLPLTVLLCGGTSLIFSLCCMAAGVLLFIFAESSLLSVSAALLFSYGAAISGYLIKNVAAQTKRGSANNRIAMNAGSLVAGIVLMATLLTPDVFFLGALALTVACVGLATSKVVDVSAVQVSIFQNNRLLDVVAWVVAGMAMGMLLFGLFSVLPQALLKSTENLPYWYGMMLILNSALVVVMQVPILKLIEGVGRFKTEAVVLFVIAGFSVLSVPAIFHVSALLGAIVWVGIISVCECAFGHIDYYSVRNKTMFIKEISIGLGAGLTVLIMRLLEAPLSSIAVGGIGATCILLWYIITMGKLEEK